MEHLLKLVLLLLCADAALALWCRHCHSYRNRICEDGLQICKAAVGESCMIRKSFSWPYDAINPENAESLCTKDCESKVELTGYTTVITTCCNTHDLCNDLDVTIAVH